MPLSRQRRVRGRPLRQLLFAAPFAAVLDAVLSGVEGADVEEAETRTVTRTVPKEWINDEINFGHLLGIPKDFETPLKRMGQKCDVRSMMLTIAEVTDLHSNVENPDGSFRYSLLTDDDVKDMVEVDVLTGACLALRNVYVESLKVKLENDHLTGWKEEFEKNIKKTNQWDVDKQVLNLMILEYGETCLCYIVFRIKCARQLIIERVPLISSHREPKRKRGLCRGRAKAWGKCV